MSPGPRAELRGQAFQYRALNRIRVAWPTSGRQTPSEVPRRAWQLEAQLRTTLRRRNR